MKKTVLSPGLLVGLSVKTRGGIEYKRQEISATQEDKTVIKRWETTSTVIDQPEYNAAQKERNRLRGLVTAVCIPTDFGCPLCPAEKESELEAAIKEAQDGASTWNAAAKYTQIHVYAIPAVIAKDSALAAEAIAAQMRELLTEARQAIQAAQPKAIKEACRKIRNMGAMLSPDLQEKTDKALKNARSIARKLVKRVEKAGESAAAVLEDINTQDLDQARYLFLDLAPLPDGEQNPEDMMPAADVQRFDGLFGGLLDGIEIPEIADEPAELDDADEEDEPGAAWAASAPDNGPAEIDVD